MPKNRRKWMLFLFFLPVGLACFARSGWGSDALCGAAFAGDCGAIRLLIAAGADPSLVGWEEHFTPLAEALRGGQAEAARLLLRGGADPNRPNDPGWGETALATKLWGSESSARSQEEVARLLKDAGGR